jgi:redox-sensitive bicupin YhaK (pirin superfamily)
MTAGRGIVHAEMPGSSKKTRGFQLWINLKKEFKMQEPEYQEHKSAEIPEYKSSDGNMKAKIVAGEVFGVKSPVRARTPTYFIDITLKNGQSYEHVIPKTWNAMIFNYNGKVVFNDSGKAVN